MDDKEVLLKIVKRLNEAKSEASKHNYGTLTYFIEMALFQAHDEASKVDPHSVDSSDFENEVSDFKKEAC
jgi:hypothetical protein